MTELTGLTVDKVELSLAKPGGGEASPRGKASRESALPTSLLACPSGGWPLNLLEVRIVGTKVACNIRGWARLTGLTGLAELTDLARLSHLTVYIVDRVDMFGRFDRVDSVGMVDTVDTVHKVESGCG